MARSGFAQTRAYPPVLLRDEEAAGSNPATPTMFSQLEARFHDAGAGFLDSLTVHLTVGFSVSSRLLPDDHQHLGAIQRGGVVVAREVRRHVHVRGHSVETELVALDVLHHEARLVVAIGRQ